MPKGLDWSFPKVILGKDESADFPTLQIDETELNIIWSLGKEGEKSVYGLMKKRYDLPKHLPDDVWCHNLQIWERRLASKKEITYHYPSIHKTVRKLERKGLVNTLKDSSGDKTKRLVNLTFQGLILYLRNTDDRQKFVQAIKHHRSFIPFAELWESMASKLSEKEIVGGLESTLKTFQVHNVRFTIEPLGMEFDGYLERAKVLFQPEEFVLERNQRVADYLKSDDARMLRESYIAYLTLNDIKRLSFTEERNLDATLADLESERELAYFENRKLSSSNSLFKGRRVREFLPRYSGIGYLLTGMFVNNLLWSKKKVERPKDYTDEFDVEYL